MDHLPLLMGSDGKPIQRLADWLPRREAIRRQWLAYLGSDPFPDLQTSIRQQAIERIDDDLLGREVWLTTAPGYEEQCYLLWPKQAEHQPHPAVLVFYYDTGTPVGIDTGSRRYRPNDPVRQIARHLAQRGYVTLTQRWFHEGYSPADQPADLPLGSRYRHSVARFAAEAPGCKGLGRAVADARRCLDYLEKLPLVDPARIACMGHSLGGKLAFYTGAFDPRPAAVISSELGIALSQSNWDAPWYLGPEVRQAGFELDHHQLLSLIAPRPFLLIAGESADGDCSWACLNSAQRVYDLYDAPGRLGMVNHRSGHGMTMPALEQAYQWLGRWL